MTSISSHHSFYIKSMALIEILKGTERQGKLENITQISSDVKRD